MRVLSIGNSFSQDATHWLSQCAASVGEYVFSADICISGCPLSKHWEKYCSGELAYSLEINGERICSITLPSVLKKGTWDVITLQQASGFSGEIESYEPYLTNLLEEIRQVQPQARILLHQTWSYETDATLEHFVRYGWDQQRMQSALVDAYAKAAEAHKLPLIRSGDVIWHLRRTKPEFDYQNGGLSLNRDGYHLSLLYGRYAASLAWIHALFGTDVREVSFEPSEKDRVGESALFEVVRQGAWEILSQE